MDQCRRIDAGAVQSSPVKVLSSQLREARMIPGRSGRTVFAVKRQGVGTATPLLISVVWMQGTVLAVQQTGCISVTLLDETGTFTVTGVDSVPKGRPCPVQGKYVMVMGTIQSCSPEPVLHAVKMADLSENPVHGKMWRAEVEDLQQNLP
ncbi:recQ-mediated genome instability protein 2 [Lepisosteus oculatus]|nr:PREDICTED: recQ-mediated genome instability protein 2 [Lepisosteus oculatus]